jgi:hypothetical protein
MCTKFYVESLQLCGLEGNIKFDLKGLGYEDLDWIHLLQVLVSKQALVNTVMNLFVL